MFSVLSSIMVLILQCSYNIVIAIIVYIYLNKACCKHYIHEHQIITTKAYEQISKGMKHQIFYTNKCFEMYNINMRSYLNNI